MPQKSLFVALALAIGLSSLSSRMAHAELPGALQVGDAKLALNGSGSRTKYMMTMYVAGLYLSQPSTDGAAVVAADEPMAIRLEITSGFVTQEKLVESLNEGFGKSTHGKPEPIGKEITQFRGCFAKAITKGDVFDFVYQPAQGVIISKNGKQEGVIPGLAFKSALFGIWLSDDPVDEGLKSEMLVAQGQGGGRK